MILSEEQRRVKALLTETIVLLCKNGLDFKSEFSIEALIGVTLDRNEVLLININESVKNDVDHDDPSGSDYYNDDITQSKVGVSISCSSNTNINALREVNESHDLPPKHHRVHCSADDSLSSGSNNNNSSTNNPNEFNSPSYPNRQNRQTRNNHHSQDLNSTSFKRSNNENFENEENQFQQKMRKLNQSNRQHSQRLSPMSNNNNNNNNSNNSNNNSMNFSGSTNMQGVPEHPVAVSTPKFKSEPMENENSSLQSAVCNNDSAAYSHWSTVPSDDCLPDFQNLVHGTTALVGMNLPTKPGNASQPFTSMQQLQPLSMGQQQQQHMQLQQTNNLPATTTASTTTSLPLSSSSQQQQQSTFFESLVLSNGQAGSRGRYKCSICFKEMRLLRDLRAHLATKHNLEKDFSCSVCGTGFTYKHNLFVHLRT
ncbi:hypothetical protein HELRODRAFT_96284, partial [Helobdella robusta]|uniref:C2H2-type domain-containing protein n=1 Tax=Helobdella robusta TaxID=6412 RepID=T1G9B1_HELRO